ncbi:MAG: hypothetical protein JRG73_05360 [Deltaproteobacteria bacterium]|nr:hypothetical protein [Deltaproteobacteria bacterium]
MMKAHEKLDILKEKNPFASNSAGDPWAGKYLDVTSINKHAFEGLCRLIGQKTRDPADRFAGLVLGEAGSGKTHLIGRILDYGKHGKSPFSFAYIQPIEDPEQTYRYLLREVMVNLCRPIEKAFDATQLDVMLGKIFRELIEKIYNSTRDEKFTNILGKLREYPTYIFRARIHPDAFDLMQTKSTELIMKQFPEIDKEFLKVLFQYRIREKRFAAVSWLKGVVLDEEDTALLQVRDRLHDSAAALEQRSHDILISLGLLLARYGQPLIVCFDQLENLVTDEQVKALGKMVEFLVNEAKAMLPLAFFRGQQWEETFKKKLNVHVIQRLEGNMFQLKGCTKEQVLEIIRSRLEFVFGENQADDLFPFDKDDLIKTFKTSFNSPRMVITLANGRLSQILDESPAAVSPIEKIKDEFESKYEIILTDLDRYQPDRARLRGALELYLTNNPFRSGYEIESLRRPGGKEKYVDFECKIKFSGSPPVPAVFIIDIERHHSSVSAALKRGIVFLESHASGRAYYIRDKRCPFPSPPRWQATNKILHDFKKRGGHVIFLDHEQVATWYALELLKYAVNSYDVTIIDANNRIRPVSIDELAGFLRDGLHGGRYPGFQILDEAMATPSGTGQRSFRHSRPSVDDNRVVQKAVEILRPVPMMMVTSQKLVESLIQSGISIDLERMLTVIGNFRDRFEVIPSKDGVLIMLKKSWVHAQS